MDRFTRRDHRAHSRMNKACSQRSARSTCGVNRKQNSQRKSAYLRKAADNKTLQIKRRSNSALPLKGRGRTISHRQGKPGQRNRRTHRRYSSRTERRNYSAYELKMVIEEKRNYIHETNKNNTEIQRKHVSHRQKTNESENVIPLKIPNSKGNNMQADDIPYHPAKQQTSGCPTFNFTECSSMCNTKSKHQSSRKISENFMDDEIKNELTAKKKSKKGFFSSAFRAVLACFGIRNDKK